jgi:flagellar motor switch protein FliM
LQNFMGEKFGRDNIWEIHLADKIREAYIRLEATLPIEELSLREVLNWKKGSYVQLSSTTQSPIHLTSENFELFLGKMGQKNGHIAVKVNDVLFGKNGETQ